MNSAGKNAVIALLVISIAGCADKNTKAVPPAQAQAPSVDAGKAGALYPPPLTPAAPETQEAQPTPPPVVAETQPVPQPETAPIKPKKATAPRKGKPSPSKPATAGDSTDASPAATAAGATTAPAPDASTEQVAAAGDPAAPSPIGQLSTGDAAGQAQTRKSTVDIITTTENGLNGIKRPLDAQEQETANQIKTFIQKAKQALTSDDLDGALTLATKAKVLLDELTKPS